MQERDNNSIPAKLKRLRVPLSVDVLQETLQTLSNYHGEVRRPEATPAGQRTTGEETPVLNSWRLPAPLGQEGKANRWSVEYFERYARAFCNSSHFPESRYQSFRAYCELLGVATTLDFWTWFEFSEVQVPKVTYGRTI